jgi:hypothetical protein
VAAAVHIMHACIYRSARAAPTVPGEVAAIASGAESEQQLIMSQQQQP